MCVIINMTRLSTCTNCVAYLIGRSQSAFNFKVRMFVRSMCNSRRCTVKVHAAVCPDAEGFELLQQYTCPFYQCHLCFEFQNTKALRFFFKYTFTLIFFKPLFLFFACVLLPLSRRSRGCEAEHNDEQSKPADQKSVPPCRDERLTTVNGDKRWDNRHPSPRVACISQRTLPEN